MRLLHKTVLNILWMCGCVLLIDVFLFQVSGELVHCLDYIKFVAVET
jgi:hypothetical protein